MLGLTCLYVGNIDKKVDSNQLTDVFRKYGDLEYCYLVYEPTSTDRNSKEVKVSRGYGFVKFVKF
jgi:RNA recognition motif-containing protein